MPRGSGWRPAGGPRVLGLVAAVVLVLALVATGRLLSGEAIRSSLRPTRTTAAPAPYLVGARLACPHTHPVLATSDGRSYPLGHPTRPARNADPVACYGTVAKAAAAGYEEAPLPAGGLELDGVYLVPLPALARDFTVLTPEHPGTTPGAPDDIYQLDGLWDLVLCYDELLEALGVEQAVLVGHSFGAMVACEVAATSPRRAKQLALIAPLGFWRDADPVVNWMALEPAEMRRRIFRDQDAQAAKTMFADGADDKAAAAARVRLAWAMGATGKFIWPIPDKGLKKRIHRIKIPTLLVWGKEDQLVPPVYADEFAQRLPGARLMTVDQASHAPQLEHPDAVARMIRDFAR